MTNEEAISLLMQAIKTSGLSARRFSKEGLKRSYDERTVRAWLSGRLKISDAVIRELNQKLGQQELPLPEPRA